MKVYGPYTSKKDGRQRVVLYDGKTRKTVSYPKYLVEQLLGITLKPNETVDHIDDNFTNNDPSNLRIITRSKHGKEDHKLIHPIELICIWCKTKHTQNYSDVKGNVKQGKAGPFCSKSCSGKYGTEVQNKRIKPFPPQVLPEHPGYYKIKKKNYKTVEDLLKEKNAGMAK